MQTLYFIAMVAGVGWLMIWSILPGPRAWGYWWPFDMREDLEAEGPAGAAGGTGAGEPPPRRGAPPRTAWRERAAAAAHDAPRGTAGLRPGATRPGRGGTGPGGAFPPAGDGRGGTRPPRAGTADRTRGRPA